jgi:hypothetical protein
VFVIWWTHWSCLWSARPPRRSRLQACKERKTAQKSETPIERTYWRQCRNCSWSVCSSGFSPPWKALGAGDATGRSVREVAISSSRPACQPVHRSGWTSFTIGGGSSVSQIRWLELCETRTENLCELRSILMPSMSKTTANISMQRRVSRQFPRGKTEYRPCETYSDHNVFGDKHHGPVHRS